MAGLFITFEGGEGGGKSTHVGRLVQTLERRGIAAIATREPGGTPTAEAIRDVILSGAVAPLGAAAEALMFSAARIDHLDKKIRPALAQGKVVVCDRFADSTRAYQGALGNLDPKFIRELERVTVGDTRPDLTIILDVPAATGLARASARRASAPVDRFEAENESFHAALRQCFLDIAAAEPERCVVIDATQPPDAVEASIWSKVSQRLAAAGLLDKTPVAPKPVRKSSKRKEARRS
ncbi:dTMP kinase [Roseiarcaceae bacterium H3SJ34-1]|uniref:dTMP kinase n=1 Tax=Terripilifer ovatus TaxID=3032367 RepID=UPI003AB99D10|nr:dTMP kinase [Roseiarcaceae bacterium H3SJ34-1]